MRKKIFYILTALIFASGCAFAMSHRLVCAAKSEVSFGHYDSQNDSPATGVKVTLSNPVDNVAEYEYWNTIDVKDIANEILTLRMLPNQADARDARSMQIVLTDAIDPEQTLSVNFIFGTMFWGERSVYGTVSYADKIDFDIYGKGIIEGTSQAVIGLDKWTTSGEYGVNGAFPIGKWGGDDVFSGTVKSIKIRMEDSVVYADANSDTVSNDTSERTLAELIHPDFIAKSSADLFSDGGVQQKLKEKYSREYAENLFSSGRVNVKFRFTGVEDDVSFLLISAGGKSLAAVTETVDTSAPALKADLTTNARVGFDYLIPAPAIRDNMDGMLTEYEVCVKAPGGQDVPVTENSFAVTETGEYHIVYSAEDAAGNVGECSETVLAFAYTPEVDFVKIYGEEPSGEYRTRQSVPIPAYQALSELSLEDGKTLALRVDVLCDGKVVETFTDGSREQEFIPVTAGGYVVVYTATDAYGLHTSRQIYAFHVVNAPHFLMPYTETKGSYGTVFTIPKVQCVYRDIFVPTDFEITAPSGQKVTADFGRRIALTEAGDYTVRYFREIEGKIFEEEMTLTSCYTADHLFAGSELHTNIANFEVPAYSQMAKTTGVLLGTSSKESFRYVNTVDLTGLTKNDQLIRFVPFSNGVEYGEFALSVTLTDKYDPSNKVVINFHSHPEGTQGKKYSFLHVNYDGRTLSRNTEDGKVTDSNSYGCLVHNTLGGYHGQVNNAPPVSLRFDASENAVYVDPNGYGSVTPWQVLDLDDSEQVGAGKEWKGFKTGEVELSLKFTKISGQSAGIIVTEVAGKPVTGFALGEQTAPVLYPSYPDRFLLNGENFGPEAAVNRAYPLPVVTAYDLFFGALDVSYSLKKQGDDTELYARVLDGRFTPTESGIYAFTVTAVNPYGKESTFTFFFKAVATVGPIELAFAEAPGTVTTGGYYTLPEILTSNGSGKIEFTVYAELNGEPLEIDALNRVYLGAVGTLRLFVDATDYLGTETEGDSSLTIEVKSPGKPVLEIEGVPDAAIVGQKLILPDFSAIDYTFNPGEAGYLPYREIRVDGNIVWSGIGEEMSGMLSIDVTTNSDTITVIYGAGKDADNLTTEREFTIAVIRGDRVRQFVIAASPETGMIDKTGVTDTVTTSNGTMFFVDRDKLFKLANPVAADGMVLRFDVLKGYADFETLVVRLEDYERSDLVLTFEIPMDSDNKKAYLKINGRGNPIALAGSFNDDESAFYLRLGNFEKRIINAAGDLICGLSEFSNRLPFNGFQSGRVRVSFEINGVEKDGQGSLVLTAVGNQSFAGQDNDEVFIDETGAEIVFAKQMKRNIEINIGETVEFSAATACDVLSPGASVKLTIRNSEGIVVEGIEDADCSFNRTVKFNNYGFFYATYTMISGENKTTFRTVVNVRDQILPEIKISGSVPETAVFGQKLKVPAAIATDNHSEAKMFVFMRRPDGRTDVISGDEYEFVKKGRHTLIYYAYDAEYNFVSIEYEILVA